MQQSYSNQPKYKELIKGLNEVLSQDLDQIEIELLELEKVEKRILSNIKLDETTSDKK